MLTSFEEDYSNFTYLSLLIFSAQYPVDVWSLPQSVIYTLCILQVFPSYNMTFPLYLAFFHIPNLKHSVYPHNPQHSPTIILKSPLLMSIVT